MEANFGGPVWHASAAPLDGWGANEQFYQACAMKALQGVGNAALGQWEEWTGTAYHIRRRLTHDEQKQVGDVQDIRGTKEAEKRRASVVRFLPLALRDWKE